VAPADSDSYAAAMFGRAAEQEQLERAIEQVRDGHGVAIAIVGEPGIGKTLLCTDIVERAHDFALVSMRGIESETRVAFAGLSDLLQNADTAIEQLSPPQRLALRTALALEPPAASSPLMIGAATLSTLAFLAEDRPVLAVIDDAHWLDGASRDAILFAARRIAHDRIMLVLAFRPDPTIDTSALQTLPLGSLDVPAADALLRAVADVDVAPAVASYLCIQTAGNPLALGEVARQLEPSQLAGLSAISEPLPVGDAIIGEFGKRLGAYGPRTRRALAVVAADRDGEVSRISSAFRALDIDLAALEPAERERVVAVDADAIRFAHPLLRTAAARIVDPPERRRIHRALAANCPSGSEAEAWHLADATVGSDESVAAKLEAVVARAVLIGGPGAGVDAAERAAYLTPPSDTRAGRFLQASVLWLLTGRTDRAAACVDNARRSTNDELLLAEVEFVAGQLESMAGATRASIDRILHAARTVAHGDPERAATMLASAGYPAFNSGQADVALELSEEALRLVVNPSSTAAIVALSVKAHALIYADRVSEALPMLDVVEASQHWRSTHSVETFVPSPATGLCAVEAYDRALFVVEDAIANARRNAPAALPFHLAVRAETLFETGRFEPAKASAAEAAELAVDAAQPLIRAWALAWYAKAAAAQGDDDWRPVGEESLSLFELLNAPIGVRGFAQSALGLGAIATADWSGAAAHFEDARSGMLSMLGAGPHVAAVRYQGDLLEALVRAGEVERARDLSAEMLEGGKRIGRMWLAAVALRGAALASGDDAEADALFRDAQLYHQASNTPFERARTELAWGEWLARRGGDDRGREQLRQAHATFDRLGARPWSLRARIVLATVGEPDGASREPDIDRLTPQEYRVAATIAGGATNKEGAATLFLSQKTIEFHLSSVYRKLGIKSRSQLARLFTVHRLEPTPSES